MSRIDKLSVQGIRAFDHRVPQAIQFETPLTLIVGTNGSGKTTIIECLKYATSGELPPNSASGRLFVHDPSMAGEKEVLGQVKISFSSTENVRMVATRILQLTVKQKARSVKQLEGSVRMIKDGERNTISSKVGEMNSMLPRCLGVSRAVLEYVIFCHQEDSFWPMSTPQQLKEKFDQIFEAQKYTRAIDNIKILQKNQKIELELLKKDEEHRKAISEKSKKVKASMNELTKSIDDLRKKQNAHEHERGEAKRKTEEVWHKIGKLELVVGELKGKRIARDTKQESVDSLREDLNEMVETDEELQSMLEQYQERIEMHNDDLKMQTHNYQVLAGEIEDVRGTISTKDREVGMFEAQKENYDRQVESRKALVRETARSREIRGYDLVDIDDAKAREFMDQISRKARDHQAEWDRARSELQDDLQTQQKLLTGLNEMKSAKKQTKEAARQSILSADRKITDLQAKQNKIPYDEGSTAALESQLQEAQDQFQKAKAELQSATWDADITSTETDLRRLEEHKEKFETELMEASRRAGDSAQLDYLQKELKTSERGLGTMKDAHGEKITDVVGRGWTPTSLESDYQRAMHDATSQLGDAEKQRNGTVQQMNYLETKVTDVRKELKTAQKDIVTHQNAIWKALECRPEDYHAEIATLEKSKADLGGDQGIYDFLQWGIKMAKEQDHCVLCRRSFKHKQGSDDNEQKAMLAQAKKLLQSYAPNANEESKKILDEVNRDLKAGKEVNSDYDSWEKLKNKIIPDKESALAELEKQHKQLVTQSEEQDAVVDEKKGAKNEIDGFSRTVQNMIKYRVDISNYEAQIKELAAKQKDAGLSRGMEAIQADKKTVDEEIKSTTARRNHAASSRDKTKSRINSLELQCSNAKGKLSTAEYQLKEKKQLQLQEDDYKAVASEEREKIRVADTELQNIESRLQVEQAKYDDKTRTGNDKDRGLQDVSNKLSASINTLKLAEHEIQTYQGGEAKLARCRREMDTAKAELAAKVLEQQNITRIIKGLQDQVSSYDETRSSISANQRYRKDLKAVQTLYAEIEVLENQNAETDKARLEKECVTWQNKRNEAANKEASVAGQLSTLDNQLEQSLKDWDTDYANSGQKYKEAHIKVETTKAAIEDLGRYGGALDKAIMKYHSMKMEEINSIIGDLWTKTYKGTDVDTIMIRSESETVKANKSYNYRVCMVKQDTEMDMRGRCSAGQKMLASIIIRLALAECFGSNCGVIALDEPTGALDSDNIKALAESLSEIIKIRRSQKNFQLIIITHDEEFLRYMNAAEFTDNYYRVFRNSEQRSTIVRQSIAEII